MSDRETNGGDAARGEAGGAGAGRAEAGRAGVGGAGAGGVGAGRAEVGRAEVGGVGAGRGEADGVETGSVEAGRSEAGVVETDSVAEANKDWLDLFVIELRLLDVGGTAIGDALASAREFLADSGQSADEAFGAPRQYAQALGLPAEPKAKADGKWVHLGAGLGLIGLLLITQSIVPLARGEYVEFGPAVLLISGGSLVVVTILPLLLPPLLRFLADVRRWKLVVAGVLGGIAGGVVPFLLSLWPGSRPLFSVPALPLVIVSAVLLLAPPLWNQFRHSLAEDPIIDPVIKPPDAGPDPLWARSLVWGINWMAVFGAVVICVVVLWVDTAAP